MRKYGKHTTLLPFETDIEASAKFDVAANVEQTNFDPFISVIVFERTVKPYVPVLEQPLRRWLNLARTHRMFAGNTNEAIVADFTQKLEAKLEGV